MFSAIGNNAAPSMFQVNSTGYVSVKTDLLLDPSQTSYEVGLCFSGIINRGRKTPMMHVCACCGVSLSCELMV